MRRFVVVALVAGSLLLAFSCKHIAPCGALDYCSCVERSDCRAEVEGCICECEQRCSPKYGRCNCACGGGKMLACRSKTD